MSDERKRRHRHARGLNVIEMMVVLVVMAATAALVAYNVRVESRRADRHTARTEIHSLEQGVRAFRRAHGHLPDSLEEVLSGPLLAKLRADPWGSPYVYARSGETFSIRSNGLDAIRSGADDATDEDDD